MMSGSTSNSPTAITRRHFIYLHVKKFALEQERDATKSELEKATLNGYLRACIDSITVLREHPAITKSYGKLSFARLTVVAVGMIELEGATLASFVTEASVAAKIDGLFGKLSAIAGTDFLESGG